MKFQTTSSRTFANALSTVAKCINSKNSLAILDTILLSQKDGKFFITGGSGEAVLTMPVDLSVVDGKWEKSICLPTKSLIAYLSALPDVVVTIEVAEQGKLTLNYCTTTGEKAKNGKADLVYMSADEYPITPAIGESLCHIVLPGAVLATQMSLARPFAASDELRPVMNNVALDVTFDSCIFVAIDGHRLYKHVHSNDPKNGGSDFYRKGNGIMLLSKSAANVLGVFALCDEVNIESDGRRVVISTDDITYSVAAFEGSFPNYNRVIPKSELFLTVSKKELLSVLKRVSLLGSATTQLVELNFNASMFLQIKSADIDLATAAEDQVFISNTNMSKPFRIGFKATTLMECINACESEDVTLWLSEPSRAALVRPADHNTPMLTLCMPMLLND